MIPIADSPDINLHRNAEVPFGQLRPQYSSYAFRITKKGHLSYPSLLFQQSTIKSWPPLIKGL